MEDEHEPCTVGAARRVSLIWRRNNNKTSQVSLAIIVDSCANFWTAFKTCKHSLIWLDPGSGLQEKKTMLKKQNYKVMHSVTWTFSSYKRKQILLSKNMSQYASVHLDSRNPNSALISTRRTITLFSMWGSIHRTNSKASTVHHLRFISGQTTTTQLRHWELLHT